MKAGRLPLNDAMFLYGEIARDDDARRGADAVHAARPTRRPITCAGSIDELRADADGACRRGTCKLRTRILLSNPLQAWVEDATLDLEYHVRRSALPARRATSASSASLVSRLHGNTGRFPPPAVGGAPHRGARGRPVRDLRQGAPRARRRLHRHARRWRAACRATRTSATRRCSSPCRRRSATPRESRARGRDVRPSCCAWLRDAARRRPGASARRSSSLVRGRRDRDDLVTPLQAPQLHPQRAHQPQPPLRDAAARDRAAQGGRPRAAGGTLNDVVLALSGAEPAPLPPRAGRAAGAAADRDGAGQRAPQGRRRRRQRGRRDPRVARHRRRRSRRAARAPSSRRRRAPRSSSRACRSRRSCSTARSCSRR